MSDLTVVIPTAGRASLLGRTLQSLSECPRPESYRGAVVVENGGQCGAEEVAGTFADRLGCRYLYVPEGNKSLALNKVLETLGNELLYFADDDVRFDPRTLAAYDRTAAGTTGGKFFGGPTGVDYEKVPPDWIMEYLPVSARGWVPGPDGKLEFLGFNWAAFAEDLRSAGGFDVNRGPGAKTGSTGQESEMQSRLRKAGHLPVYVREAMVWHYVPLDRSSPEWAIARAYRNGVAYGMQSAAGALNVFGCPPWVMLRCVKGAARGVLAKVTSDPRQKFEADAKRSYNRGLVEGFRLKRDSTT